MRYNPSQSNSSHNIPTMTKQQPKLKPNWAPIRYSTTQILQHFQKMPFPMGIRRMPKSVYEQILWRNTFGGMISSPLILSTFMVAQLAGYALAVWLNLHQLDHQPNWQSHIVFSIRWSLFIAQHSPSVWQQLSHMHQLTLASLWTCNRNDAV